MNYSWKADDFSTEVLGFKSAKIVSIETASDIKNLVEDLRGNRIEYATFRVSSNNFETIHALEKAGFLLVDGLISLDAEVSKSYLVDSKIRPADESDLGGLRSITEGMFVVSRIYNDPLITKDKADNFYIKWIENSVMKKVADEVLVWSEDKILGYVTLQKKGQIPLIGVDREVRGKGIGGKLIEAAFNTFSNWGVKTVKIETQMANVPALRVDIDSGFKIVNSYLTFRWSLK